MSYILGAQGPTGPAGTSGATAGSINIAIDGAGGVINIGPYGGYVTIPYSCTITGWDLFSGVTGSIVIDTWKTTYAGYPPTVANTIWSGVKPTLATQSKNTSSGLSIAVTAGDIMTWNVDSVVTCLLINLNIKTTR